jgi:flavocytochrome c
MSTGTRDLDVIVVGSGLAGLCAANAAWEAGARRILVAESEAVVGGSSRLSGGIIMGAGTRLQREAGIDDDPDALFHDYMALNRWQIDAAVVRRLCDHCGETVDWLADHGVPFSPRLILGGDEREPRSHATVGNGQAAIDAMHRLSLERDIDIALGRRVDRLVVDEGQVVGVASGDEELTAHAVVIATGGFGANPELLARFFPSAAATEWTWYIGADGSRGDALTLGESVDAQTIGHDRGLRLLHPNFVRTYEAYLPAWVVVVDSNGRRFYDESAPYGIVDNLHREQGDLAWVIFDDAALRFEGERAQYKDPVMNTRLRSPNLTPVMIDEQVERGTVHRAHSIDELAMAAGLPADTLVSTIQRYNLDAAAGEDRQFLKAATFMQPVTHAPFYAVQVRPATVCFTSYGLRIDPDAAVLDRWSRPVPGLYAAGECTGGVIGDVYMGSGNSLGSAATMGRLAGSAAARRAVDASQASPAP